MPRNRKQAGHGFTLVELLVAITMLALIGAMSYRGVKSSVEARDRIYTQNERWRAFTSKSESERRNSNDSIIP